MAVLNLPNDQDNKGIAQILGSAHLLRAYIECSDELQVHAKKMILAMSDPELDEQDRYLAATTLYEILMPDAHEGDGLGMDLEECEQAVKNHSLPAGHPLAVEYKEAAEQLDLMDQEEATFSERLERLMADRDLSQTELAKRVGIGQPAVAMMLSRNCRPQKRTVTKLADALGVEPGDLWPGFQP